jgi:hypothetical protein
VPSFGDVAKVVEGIAREVSQAIQNVAPTKSTVELELSLEYGSGGLLALFASAKGTGDLKVTLEWDKA